MTHIALIFVVFCLSFFVLSRRKKERGDCVICGKDVFDPNILDGLAFCSKHGDLYLEGTWETFKKGHATPNDPEFGVRLFELKLELNANRISSFIKSEYSQSGEEIVTEMVLMVLKEDLEKAEAFSKSW